MGTTSESIIGIATPRIDGPLKTTGAAEYAADFHFDRMAYAVPVGAAIASGRIRRLDASAAEQMPGVLLVLHHGNMGPLFRTVPGDDNATNSEVRSAFEDEVVRHWGQHVAVVIAETLEQATAGAAAVEVEYEPQPANLRVSLDDYKGERKSVVEARRSRYGFRFCAGEDRRNLHHADRNAQSDRDARLGCCVGGRSGHPL